MENKLTVMVENRDGQLVVTSRQIAKELGKEHSKVLRTLKGIATSGDTPQHLFIPSVYVNEQNGQTYDEYLLTKDGFILYMFNIQGHNEFKLAYINEFNRMEQALKNNVPQITQEQQLVLAIYNGGIDAIESTKQLIALKTKPLEEVIEKNKPKVDTYDVVFEDKYYDARELASMLNIKRLGRNNLLAFLRDLNFLDKHNVPYRKYIEQKLCKQIPTTKLDVNGNNIMKTLFSDKMLKKLIRYNDDNGFDKYFEVKKLGV